MSDAGETHQLRAEVARLTARVAELEAGDSAALRDSRQRLDYALSAAHIVAWDWDPVNGHVQHSTDVNHNIRDQVTTRTDYARMIHPDDAPRVAQAFDDAYRAGTEYRAEYRILTPAGTRWIMSAGRPFETSDGGRRMSGIVLDVTARHDADDDLRESAEHLRLAIDAAQLGDWSADRATNIVELSERAAGFLGLDGPCAIPRPEVHAPIHPDDLRQLLAQIDDALERREAYVVEFRVPHAAGTRWLMMSGRGTYGDDGSLVGQIGVMQDITARRDAEERQQLLMRELNHRVKNTLAIVQALALQSRRGSTTPEAFSESFDGRLRTLSAAHSLLTRTSWQGAGVAEVAHGALQPFDTAGQRIAMAGPPVLLASSVALNLALGLHELATNALKYGSLSGESGTVSLEWSIDGDALMVRWLERGGPVVVLPERRGFGVRLIKDGVTREVGGAATLDFRPEGLICELRLPLSDKVRPL